MRGDPSPSERLSITDAADTLGISPEHLTMLLDHDRIACETTSAGERRIRRADIEEYQGRQERAYAALRESMLAAEHLATMCSGSGEPKYVLERQPDGGFVIYVPGLPGLSTEGASRDAAIAMLRDALPAYVASMRTHGRPPEHMTTPEARATPAKIDSHLLDALHELHPGSTGREILERLANVFLLKRRIHAVQTRSTLTTEEAERIADAELAAIRRERAEAAADPMLEARATAPLDDEPSTAAEDRSAREAITAYERGEAVSADELKRDLGLD